MPISATDLNKAYLAYFGRPVDFTGKTHFANLELADVIKAFDSSAESQALYGSDVAAKVNAIYNNLFNRDAEPAGLLHWSTLIGQGRITAAEAAFKIMEGALGSDVTAVQNKLSASEAFAAELNTTAELLGYSGMAAAAAARAFLKTVDATPASLTAAVAAVAATVATVAASGGPAGQTFTLTQGLDNIVGTSGNDTINAFAFNSVTGADTSTLNSVDSVDGGTGTDTLNIEVKGGVPFNGTLQGTIKNVEIININNTANTGAVPAVVASLFQGATAINQIDKAAAVTELAAGTVAGFKGTASSVAAALDVKAAAAAVSAAVNLDGAKGVDALADGVFQAGDNTVGLKIAGAALNSVTVTGTVAQAVKSTIAAQAANLDLNVTGSSTATSFSLNTAVNTALTLTGMAAVTSVDTSASAGGVTFNGTTQVQTFTTGAGGDTVTSAFATTATKAATITTGAGNDTINVNTTGAGLTTVDAGAGNDRINVVKVAGNKLNIQGGEGNDTVVLFGAALATTDVVDGGAGTDTVSLTGSLTARTDDDFIVLNSLLKGFETLKLSTAEGTTLATGLNVAKLGTNYTTIDFATSSYADNVGTQKLVANGDLNAEAVGYKSLVEAQTANASATSPVYAGALNVTEKVTGTVTATAQSVALTVDASTAAVIGTLAGDVKSATVSLVQGVNGKGTPETTDDVLFASKAVVTNATTLTNLESLTISGNGVADVINASTTKLVTVDASGLNSVDIAGKVAAGLTYVSNNALAETITLGAGKDSITLNASTYGAINAKTFDTVTGLNLVLDGVALAASSDTIKVGPLNGFTKFTNTLTDLDLALKNAAVLTVSGAAKDKVVFHLGGDTYIYSDLDANNEVNGNDVLVKLTGTIDLDTLVIALG